MQVVSAALEEVVRTNREHHIKIALRTARAPRVAFAGAYLRLSCRDAVQAADRADLRDKLRVGGGGLVLTTIQKRSTRCR